MKNQYGKIDPNNINSSVLKFKSEISTSKFINIFIIVLFTAYSLYLFDLKNSFLSNKMLMFLLLVILLSFSYSVLLTKGKAELRDIKNRTDIIFLLAGIFGLIGMIVKLFSGSDTYLPSYETELVILLFAILYFLIASVGYFKRYFFELLLYAALLIFAGLLFHFLADTDFMAPIALLLSDPRNIASYTMLVVTVSICLYCQCQDKMKSIFYLGVCIIGFFVLFINYDLISICITGILFLLIPLIFIPTAELIKRNMQLAFLYFFLLSNMGLLINYTPIIQKDLTFDIMNSIYIDLVMAIVGILFFQYWERIPQEVDLRYIILRRLQRAYRFVFKFTGILLLAVLLIGNRWQSMPDGWVLKIVKTFGIAFNGSVRRTGGIFGDAAAGYGLTGLLFLVACYVVVMARLKKNYRPEKTMTNIFIILSIVYLTQSLFYSPDMVSGPLYMTMLIYALTYQEETLPVILKSTESGLLKEKRNT